MDVSPVYSDVPLDKLEISQTLLNIENKYRSNPFVWNGQFSPQFVEAVLKKYTIPQTAVLDPFVGSGTVLLEAGRLGLKAHGAEINPAAIALAQTYLFINQTIETRRTILATVSQSLKNVIPDFALHQLTADLSLKQTLLNLLHSTLNRLEYQLLETLITLIDFQQPAVFATWDKLNQHILHLPYSTASISLYHTDARKIPLADNTIDFVLTSPPYINVFNYHQQYRAASEALNWDLLKIAKSEIGSNRKNRGNRFLTVIQFCLDIALTFAELARVCKPTARIIFVVGRESNVRNTKFYNGQIVAEIGVKSLGFELKLRQERMFTNRYGNNIVEDILHFTPAQTQPNNYLDIAKELGILALREAQKTCEEGSLSDLRTAIQRAATVMPSPHFKLHDIGNASL